MHLISIIAKYANYPWEITICALFVCVIRVQFKRMKKTQLKSNENKIYLNKINAFLLFLYSYIYFLYDTVAFYYPCTFDYGGYTCAGYTSMFHMKNLYKHRCFSSSRLYNKAVDQRTMNKRELMSTNHFFCGVRMSAYVTRGRERQRERERKRVSVYMRSLSTVAWWEDNLKYTENIKLNI